MKDFFKVFIFIIIICVVFLNGCSQIDILDIDSISENVQLLFERTPEYPYSYLPQYINSEIISYAYDNKSHTIYTTSASCDSFNEIADYFSSRFATHTDIDYKVEYYLDDEYYVYGMIGNFTFFIEIAKAGENIKGDYTHTITTNIHYLLDEELQLENEFRELKGTNAEIYIYPEIKIYQQLNDADGIYFEFPIYKMDLINKEYGVELYINNILYSSRQGNDTIRINIDDLVGTNTIKMVAYDNNNCIRGVDIIDKLFLMNAVDSTNIQHITGEYPDISTMYIYNVSQLADISSIENLSNLEELYIIGENKIEDFTPVLNLEKLSLLALDGFDSPIISELSSLKNLKVLTLKNSNTNKSLSSILVNTSIIDLEITNSDNIAVSTSISDTKTVERIYIKSNNYINLLQFAALQPSIRIIEIDSCASFEDIIGMDNIVNFNMLSVKDCASYSPQFPFDNLVNLGYVHVDNCPLIDGNSTISKTLFSNNSIFGFKINNGFNGYSSDYSNDKSSNEGIQ